MVIVRGPHRYGHGVILAVALNSCEVLLAKLPSSLGGAVPVRSGAS